MTRSNMPTGQLNANLSPEMVMRIGIPHRGGRLAFHAFNQGYPAMVSAAAFWDAKASAFKIPDATNVSELDFALDSAGFTAMSMWASKGKQPGMAGVFPWTYTQYLELANTLSPAWYSAPDLCVEPQIASTEEEINYRIDATATLLEGCMRILYAWQEQLAKDVSTETVASMVRLPTPVIQGWSKSNYQRSLELTLKVWERWQPWAAPPALIGVGSVCKRNLNHPEYGLHAILAGLESMIPKGSRLHLFGVKGAVLNEVKMLPWIASADSMAFDFSARVKAHREGVSNTIEHRSGEMTRWMQGAIQRLQPAPGDQFRLAF